ncbi:MAG: hypothetical protein Q8O74_08800 [bacterium]|nr:hypothetical protein [bacterium]
MFQIRCTGRVQKELGFKKQDLCTIKEGEAVLGEWYLHLFTVDHRKAFIFMNEKTLLSFVVYGIKQSNKHKIGDMFIVGLAQTLALAGFDSRATDKALIGCNTAELTNTHSRSLLCKLNSHIYDYKFRIMREGSLKFCDLDGIIKSQNKMPQKNLKWASAIEAAQKLLNP